jgi:hypothetical protein
MLFWDIIYLSKDIIIELKFLNVSWNDKLTYETWITKSIKGTYLIEGNIVLESNQLN